MTVNNFEETLDNFINNFYGYGNPLSDYWFVGLEEGGGNKETEIINRINSWDKRFRKCFEDLRNFHESFDEKQFFQSNPKIQPVWKRYIQILFGIKNIDFFDSKLEEQQRTIQDFQRIKFGKEDGEVCLLELRPLPSPTLKDWKYNKFDSFSNFSFLKDRLSYEERVHPQRIKKIRDLIDKYKPKFVVFFSDSQNAKTQWNKIINYEGDFKSFGNIDYKLIEGMTYIILKHPINVQHLYKNNDLDISQYYKDLSKLIIQIKLDLKTSEVVASGQNDKRIEIYKDEFLNISINEMCKKFDIDEAKANALIKDLKDKTFSLALNISKLYQNAFEKDYGFNREDLHASMFWLELGAMNGNAEAQFRLGLEYSSGEHLPKNRNEALMWVKLAAEQNHSEAKIEMNII